MRISLDYIAKILLSFFVVGYVLLPLLFSDMVSFVVKSGILLCLAIVFGKSRAKNRSSLIKASLIPLFCVAICQFLIFRNTECVKLFVNLFCFFIFFRNSSSSFAKSFIELIKLGTLLAIFPVVYFCIKYQALYYFRDFIGIQKQTMSILLLFGTLFSALGTLWEKSKFSFVFFCSFLFFNLFIIQSKSSLLVVVVLLFLAFYMDKGLLEKFKRMALPLILLFLIAALLFPSLMLPDDIRYGVNRLSGAKIFSESSERSEERLSATYDVRNDLVVKCLDLFNESPIFGVGIGNFAKISKKNANVFYDLSETESEWLGVITEGGVTYSFALLLFFTSCLYKSFKLYKKNFQNKLSLVAFVFFGGFFMMFFFNDFMDSIFFIGGGILLGGAVNFNQNSIAGKYMG